MTNYKITYFDFHGGRGEPVRIAMHAAGLAFEDVRWSFDEFGAKQQTLRFHSVPALEMDGTVVSQSNAISRYIGKMAGLYPEDALQALYCDEVLGVMEDLNHYFVQTFGLEGDALKQAREDLMNGSMSVIVKGLEEVLVRGGGQYFADRRLTIADLKALVLVKHCRSGGMDHIPADFIDKLAPSIAEHQERIEREPQVVAYYAAIKQ